MHVLVLGGTGLISTAIVKRLLDQRHDVTLFNRGNRNRDLEATPVKYILGDRYDFNAFASSMAGFTCDAVIDMITFNADTAKNSVDVFGGRIAHYLFCSTVCVYGGPLNTIPAVETEPHKPTGEYGMNKSKAEAVFMDAHRSKGFPVTMFRPSHCYGEGASLLDIWGYSGALISRLREGRPIIVPGDGYGLWQPGYTGDMAKGFVGALGRDKTHGKAYNIVGDEIMTWRVFHERAAAAIGGTANLVCMTSEAILAGAPLDKSWMLKEIFQYHAAYSNEELKRDVPEFRDLLTWEEGVRRTVDWADSHGLVEPASVQPWVDALVHNHHGYLTRLSSTIA